MSLVYRVCAVHRQEFEWWRSWSTATLNLAAHGVTFFTEMVAGFFIAVVGYSVASTATTSVAWETAPAFGLTIAIMHATFVACEMCAAVDFNPSFSLASLFLGYYSIPKAFVMICGQVLGWFLGGLFSLWLVGSSSFESAVNTPQISFWQCVLVETLMTTMAGLVVVLATRHARSLSISLLVGLAVTLGLVGSGVLGAGASLNFARSFGAAIAAGKTKDLGQYALSNLFSALLVTLLVWVSEWFTPYARTYERLRIKSVDDADALFHAGSDAPLSARKDAILLQELSLVNGEATRPSDDNASTRQDPVPFSDALQHMD